MKLFSKQCYVLNLILSDININEKINEERRNMKVGNSKSVASTFIQAFNLLAATEIVLCAMEKEGVLKIQIHKKILILYVISKIIIVCFDCTPLRSDIIYHNSEECDRNNRFSF